jgi:conjugative transposon TraM protein
MKENIKGYLGSRIVFRLLEDINAGEHKISKGQILYAQISGFNQQRVNLNVVSVLANGEILPINLSVYDVDGMKGLYVPASEFREMMREMGTNSIQGTQLNQSGEDFFSSMASKLFTSTSTSIANLIKKNKVKLKYNSHIYLINEQSLKEKK